MERALKVSSAERGHHPRDFTLIGFGGGGPVHAAAVAREVGFEEVLIPKAPGVFSAFGLHISDIRHDFTRSYVGRTDEVTPDILESLYAEMEKLGTGALEKDGIAPEDRIFHRTADLRYVGQAYEVNVPVPAGTVDKECLASIVSRFHAEHQRLFAHSAENDLVEFVNFRLIANGSVELPVLRKLAETSGTVKPSSIRKVYIEEVNDAVDCPVYERSDLHRGTSMEGPVIIEQIDTTTFVHPGMKLTVDEWGNMIIETGIRQ